VTVDIELDVGDPDEDGELTTLGFESHVSSLAKGCMSGSPES
jgi:hypothetical protein